MKPPGPISRLSFLYNVSFMPRHSPEKRHLKNRLRQNAQRSKIDFGVEKCFVVIYNVIRILFQEEHNDE